MAERVVRFDPRLAAAIGGVVGTLIYGLTAGWQAFDLSRTSAAADLMFHLAAGALLFGGGAMLRNRLKRPA